MDGYLELACSPVVPHGGRNKELAVHFLHALGGSIKVRREGASTVCWANCYSAPGAVWISEVFGLVNPCCFHTILTTELNGPSEFGFVGVLSSTFKELYTEHTQFQF